MFKILKIASLTIKFASAYYYYYYFQISSPKIVIICFWNTENFCTEWLAIIINLYSHSKARKVDVPNRREKFRYLCADFISLDWFWMIGLHTWITSFTLSGIHDWSDGAINLSHVDAFGFNHKGGVLIYSFFSQKVQKGLICASH